MKKINFLAALVVAAFAFVSCNNNPGGGSVENIDIPQLVQSLIQKSPAEAEAAVLNKGYVKATEDKVKVEDSYEYLYSYSKGATTFSADAESLIGFDVLNDAVVLSGGTAKYDATKIAKQIPSDFNTLDNNIANEDYFQAIIDTEDGTKLYLESAAFNELLDQAKQVSEELYEKYRSQYGTKEDFKTDLKSLNDKFVVIALEIKLTDQNKLTGKLSQLTVSTYEESEYEVYSDVTAYTAMYGDVSDFFKQANESAKGIAPLKFMKGGKMLKK
mgnify:FL=1